MCSRVKASRVKCVNGECSWLWHLPAPWAGPSYTVVPGLLVYWSLRCLDVGPKVDVVDDSPEAVSVVQCYLVVQTTVTSDDVAPASTCLRSSRRPCRGRRPCDVAGGSACPSLQGPSLALLRDGRENVDDSCICSIKEKLAFLPVSYHKETKFSNLGCFLSFCWPFFSFF